MIETPMNKTETVAELILAELASTDHPLASPDLYDRLEIDISDTVIHRALRNLLIEDRIEIAGTATGKRGNMVKAYRLPTSASDAARLIEHLESELEPAESPAAHFASRILDQENAVASETCLDNAAASHNGDELHVIHAHLPGQTQADVHTDPVLHALRQMRHRVTESRVTALDSTRLRALAQCLDAGYRIDPDPALITWLADLATILEETNA